MRLVDISADIQDLSLVLKDLGNELASITTKLKGEK